VAIVLLMLNRCGSGGGTVEAPVQPLGADPALGTYLEEAVPFGQRFRWTPSAGSSVVDIPIEIFDGDGEVPDSMLADGFHPTEIERQVRAAFDNWAVPLRAAGLPAPVLEIRRHSRGETFGEDRRTRIRIFLDEDAGRTFRGETAMLRIGTRLDRVREVDITLFTPSLGPRPGLDGYHALLLHEVGHALGILAEAPANGHSGTVTDVMFPIANWTEISPEDQRAIQALYGSKPDFVREDLTPPGNSERSTPEAPSFFGFDIALPTIPGWESSAPSSVRESVHCSVDR
jgi:hypothetical protein